MLSAVLLAIALQSTTTRCTPLGGTVICNSQTTPAPTYTPPPITHVDVPGALRRAEEMRAMRDSRVADTLPPAAKEVSAGAPATYSPGTTGVPTSRELYAGCLLLLQGTDVAPLADGQPPRISAAMCRLMSEAAIFRMATNTPENLRFCLPVDMRDRPREMATAYVDVFSQYPALLMPLDNGPTAYGVAMSRRWPCQPG